MAQPFVYHVMPDPDGHGWIVTAEGFVARSLPYDTMDRAIEAAELLVRRRPRSALLVDARPPALTPIEIEHRLSA